MPVALQHAKNKVLEQRLEVLTTERDDAKILAKELKVMPVNLWLSRTHKAAEPHSYLQYAFVSRTYLQRSCHQHLSVIAAVPVLALLISMLPGLQSQTSRPQGASEMQMVAAVAQATRAAAEAATAAAGAAAICIIDPRAGTATSARTNSRKSSKRRQPKPIVSSSSEDADEPTPSPA